MVNETITEDLPVIHEVYPLLHVRGGAAAIDFYEQVFGAQELLRLAYPNGRIAHTELKLGSLTLMLADEHPGYGVLSPLAFGGTGSSIHLHVDNVDRLALRAIEAGATMVREPADEGHGERRCLIRDPFGHQWLLGHQTESVSPEEIQRRFEAQFKLTERQAASPYDSKEYNTDEQSK